MVHALAFLVKLVFPSHMDRATNRKITGIALEDTLSKNFKWRLIIIAIALFGFTSCNPPKSLFYSYGENILVHDSNHTNSTHVLPFLQTYKDSLFKKMSKTLVHLDTFFSNQYTTGNLGNLTADYMLIFSNSYGNYLTNRGAEHYCDFAVLNNGSLRNNLSPGPVTLGDVFEAMPYDNSLIIIQLNGAQTDSLFQHIAAKNGAYLANASCTINNNKAEKVIINGQRFDSRKSYTLAINDYMLLGGDGYSVCKNAKYVWKNDITIRDIIVEGLQQEFAQTKTINSRSAPRILLMQPTTNRH